MILQVKFGAISNVITISERITSVQQLKSTIRKMFEMEESMSINVYFEESIHTWKKLYSPLQLLRLAQLDHLDLYLLTH